MEGHNLTDRQTYLDYLRVFATAAVILLHVAGQNWYAVDVDGTDWATFNFYSCIVRWGVPVFVMISGALFLNKRDILIKKIISKYILRLIIAYAVWSFIYYLFAADTISRQFVGLFRPGKIARWIIVIKGHYHMWFIPMIVGIYLCIPIIKQIIKNEKVMQYYLALSFVFWFVLPQALTMMRDFGNEKVATIADAINNVLDASSMAFVQNFVFYFILGYALAKKTFGRKTRIMLYILGSAGFAFTIIIDWLIAVKTYAPNGAYYGNNCVNILLEVVFVFELCKNIQYTESRIGKAVQLLSNYSFGAYLVHPLLIEQLAKHGITTLSLLPVLAVPCLAAIVFLGAFMISAILHQIPVLKKYIV